MPRKKSKARRSPAPTAIKKARKAYWRGRKSSKDKFKSGLERMAAALLTKFGFDFLYEPDKISYVLHCNYLPDFKIGEMYIETKGRFTPDDRRKMLAVKKQNPELDIRIWFSYDAPIAKKSKTKYSDWCVKHGFPWHEGDTFPRHWFKD